MIQTSRLIPSRASSPCPVCGDIKGDCRIPADADYVLCQKNPDGGDHPHYKYLRPSGGQSAGLWGVFAPRKDEKIDSAEWHRQQLQRQTERQKRLEEEALMFRSGLSRAERDQNIRALSRALGLKQSHRQQLRDRGLTDEQIDNGLFFSVEPNYPVPDYISGKLAGIKYWGSKKVLGTKCTGFACVAFDHQGQATGYQFRDENPTAQNKYKWAISTFSSKLQTGELPITKLGQGEWVVICEGILKPYIVHSRFGIPVIGASSANFSGAPIQLRAALGTTKTIAIAMDAGDALNPHRLQHWESVVDLFPHTYRVWFAWWDQWSKPAPDCDEIPAWQVKYLSPEQMGEIIANYYKKLFSTVNFLLLINHPLAIKFL